MTEKLKINLRQFLIFMSGVAFFVCLFSGVAEAAGTTIDSAIIDSQSIMNNEENFSIIGEGDISVVADVTGAPALLNDRYIDLTISIDVSDPSKGISASKGSFGAIEIIGAGELDSLTIVSGTVTSDIAGAGTR